MYFTTPILGFTTSLFAPGDNIFVEGVQMDTDGDGYNSEDYEYKFFKVIDYINSSPAILTLNLKVTMELVLQPIQELLRYSNLDMQQL